MKGIVIYSDLQDRPIGEIKPYWNNPRSNEKTRQALVDAYKKIGFNQPILVDQEGVIVKGHARYYAAKLSGMETIPTLVSLASDAQNKEDRILDNSIQDLSVWDPDGFEVELGKVDMRLAHVFEDVEDAIKEDFSDPTFDLECPGCGHKFNPKRSELLALEEVE